MYGEGCGMKKYIEIAETCMQLICNATDLIDNLSVESEDMEMAIDIIAETIKNSNLIK